MSDNQYLSAYLYYNEPWETFLHHAVAPYLKTVLNTGIAESYFFIRYWERGPHIRLRFKGEPNLLQEVLKPNLTEHFNTYFLSNPSERTEPEYPENYPKEHRWLPNNSIEFQAYEPEIHRYGGSLGMTLAENQFRLSTDTVLELTNDEAGPLNYDEMLGLAIRLHVSFVHSLGFDQIRSIHFFNMIFENWLPRAVEVFEYEATDEEIISKMNETMHLFKESFTQQKEELVAFHSELYEILKSESNFDSKAIKKWILENRNISLELTKIAESGNLAPRSDQYVISEDLKNILSEQEILLWNIFADYVHMTNNRLGIFNHDEAYLAYLIKRSIEELS